MLFTTHANIDYCEWYIYSTLSSGYARVAMLFAFRWPIWLTLKSFVVLSRPGRPLSIRLGSPKFREVLVSLAVVAHLQCQLSLWLYGPTCLNLVGQDLSYWGPVPFYFLPKFRPYLFTNLPMTYSVFDLGRSESTCWGGAARNHLTTLPHASKLAELLALSHFTRPRAYFASHSAFRLCHFALCLLSLA